MFSAFEWMMAMRYLRARRQEGFISVIAWFSLMGIGLGVATLIIVMSVMNGFREELLTRILGLNGHLSVYATTTTGLSNFDKLADTVRQTDGVVSATPLIEGQVMASSPRGISQGALVRGIRKDDLKARKVIADNIVTGSLDNFGGVDTVIIGDRLANKMRLYPGDQITLISPKGNVTAFGSVPRIRTYRIAGTFNIGMYEYDSSFIYMPLQAAQIYFKHKETVTNLEVMLDDADQVFDVKERLAASLPPTIGLHDWQQSNASFFNAIQVERNVMFLILTLIIIVAAFNIISSMIMLVKDKGRDIAILRTMGARRSSIMRIFFIAGASVGVIGTFFGFVLGLAFCLNIETIRQWIQSLTGTELFSAEIYFLSKLPAKVDTAEVITVVVMALVLTFLATLYPSWRASRLDPAEALRYE